LRIRLANLKPKSRHHCLINFLSLLLNVKNHLLSFWLPLSTLFTINLAAWFSEGYHHPDEHFQVLELANYKLGRSAAADLPWEFSAQIRPGLQPLLAAGAIRALQQLGVENPFLQVWFLRLSIGLLFLLTVWHGSRLLETRQPGVGKWLWIITAFTWFVPYLAVRFSAENLSGICLAWGLMLLTAQAGLTKQKFFRDAGWRWAVAGLCFGAAFCFRYQTGFALAGVGAWLLSQKKYHFSGWFLLLTGGLIAVAIGALADRWLYGTWVLTPYHYFHANIVENKAAQWGTAPWYFYFVETTLSMVPPLSLLLLAAAGRGFWVLRRSVVAWAFVPFVIAHVATAHKELRFLFPMLLPFIVFAAVGIQQYQLPSGRRLGLRLLAGFLLALNFILLAVTCLKPAQECIPCFRFIWEYHQKKPGSLAAVQKHPYEVVGLKMNFYCSKNTKPLIINQLEAIPPHEPVLLLHDHLQLSPTAATAPLHRVFAVFPDWLLRYNINDWHSRSRIWSVWEKNAE